MDIEAEPYVRKPPTITEWLEFIGWTAYPLILIAVFLAVWSVRLLLRTPSSNQIGAFAMAAILPTFIGLLGLATGWRNIVDIKEWEDRVHTRVFWDSDDIVLSPMIGMIESVIFLSLTVIILLKVQCSSGEQLSPSPESIAERSRATRYSPPVET